MSMARYLLFYKAGEKLYNYYDMLKTSLGLSSKEIEDLNSKLKSSPFEKITPLDENASYAHIGNFFWDYFKSPQGGNTSAYRIALDAYWRVKDPQSLSSDDNFKMGSCLGNDLLSDKLVVAADVDSNLRCVKALECLQNAFTKSSPEKRGEVKLAVLGIMERLLPQLGPDAKKEDIDKQINDLKNRNKWLEGLQWDRVNSGMREMLSYLATKQTEKKVIIRLGQMLYCNSRNSKRSLNNKLVRINLMKS